MNYRAVVIIYSLMLPLSVLADANIPPDIEHFINTAETCSHLAGEWDNSLPKAQQEEIEQKASYYCIKTKKKLRALLVKYKDNPEITKLLREYEDLANSISDE